VTATAWPEVPLGEVATVVSGATPKTAREDYWNGDVCWATPKDLSELGAKFIEDTPRKLTPEGLQACAAAVLPAGSVLLSSRAPIGLVAINTVPMATNQGFKSLVPNLERVDSNYLYWWLVTNRRKLESLGRGATFKEISKAITAQVEIPLPPVAEQRRIAAILDVADGLRDKRRESLALLDSLAESIFLDMFGDLIEADGRCDWVELATVVDPSRPVRYGILKPGPDLPDGRPYVRVVDMVDGGLDHKSVRRTSAEIDHQYRRSRVGQGDLLMSIRGHVGRVTVVPEELDGANITQDSCRIALVDADPWFVLAWLRLKPAQDWMRRNTKGVAVRGINIGDVRRLPVPLPPRPQQREFAQRFQQVAANRHLLRASADDLDALFASLQHRAFRGEL
jgi:type I restriction enzyme, S subunit